CSQLAYTSPNTGAIIKNVKNKASPINTWFGGICCVAREVRTNDKTMMILVKLVINIKILGAKDKTVNSNNNFTEAETDEGSEPENISTNSFMLIFLLYVIINDLFSRMFKFFEFFRKKTFKFIF